MTAQEGDLLAEALVDLAALAAAPRGLTEAKLARVGLSRAEPDAAGNTPITGVAEVLLQFDGGDIPARWTGAFAAEVTASGGAPRGSKVLVATVNSQPIALSLIHGKA